MAKNGFIRRDYARRQRTVDVPVRRKTNPEVCILKRSLLLCLVLFAVSSFAQTTILDNLEEQIFLTCGNCGNSGSTGTAAKFTVVKESTLSRDGTAALFSVSAAGAPYANGYWYQKRVGTVAASHFELEFDVLIPAASILASHAIEFEAQQVLSGNTYDYAWQGLLSGTKTWRYFDKVNRHWIDSKIPVNLSADVWHHIKAEYSRTTDNRTNYIALTVDGLKTPLNVSEAALVTTSKDYLSNAFQLDTNKLGTAYSVYMDKLTLKYW
jgi:hypothetical protein